MLYYYYIIVLTLFKSWRIWNRESDKQFEVMVQHISVLALLYKIKQQIFDN